MPRRGWLTRGLGRHLVMDRVLFNIVEGVVDHPVLKVHGVREDGSNPEVQNRDILVLSVMLMAIGIAAYEGADREHSHRGRTPPAGRNPHESGGPPGGRRPSG